MEQHPKPRGWHHQPGHAPSPSDEILEAQVREIAEMKRLIAELEANPPADDAPDLAPSPQTTPQP
jgi:hypothetical protein